MTIVINTVLAWIVGICVALCLLSVAVLIFGILWAHVSEKISDWWSAFRVEKTKPVLWALHDYLEAVEKNDTLLVEKRLEELQSIYKTTRFYLAVFSGWIKRGKPCPK